MDINNNYTETGAFISDSDVDKKASHILNMINKNNDKDVIVSFNFNAVLYGNYYCGDELRGSPSKRIKKSCGVIINDTHEIYNSPDKVRGFTLSDNDTNRVLSEGCNLITTGESARSISDKRGSDILSVDIVKNNNILLVQREITEDNTSMVQPEEIINIISDEKIYGHGKINIILTEMPTGGIPVGSPVPSELPVFFHHAIESSETKNSLPNIELNQPGNGEQGKIFFLSSDTGKYPTSQENNRSDYYFSYYFRQKDQPSEQVYIYRDQSNRFKLDTHSELIKRKLKLAMNVNMVDNIDIL